MGLDLTVHHRPRPPAATLPAKGGAGYFCRTRAEAELAAAEWRSAQ